MHELFRVDSRHTYYIEILGRFIEIQYFICGSILLFEVVYTSLENVEHLQ
jgi:hypothetical protein